VTTVTAARPSRPSRHDRHDLEFLVKNHQVRLPAGLDGADVVEAEPAGGRGRREPGGNLQWQAGVDDRQQLGSQRLQVELLAKPPAERRDGRGRVIAAAVEAIPAPPSTATTATTTSSWPQAPVRDAEERCLPSSRSA